jgi:hypothetical protein
MRIYRDHGFAVIENIAAYNLNQLYVELLGNYIRITQLGSNRGEIKVHHTIIRDGFGNNIGETAQDVFDYVESVIYGSTTSTGDSTPAKSATLTFSPPARNQYTIALSDNDAIVGSDYQFILLPNQGEIEWNCIVAYGHCHINGQIDVYVHAPTGLIVGSYNFKYKVV